MIQWNSQWERPELWLFDLHHHLFGGDVGELVIGIVALCGLFFVITGLLSWWRARETFEWRLLPARMTQPAIVRHHRDLGVVVAPVIAAGPHSAIENCRLNGGKGSSVAGV